MGAGGWVVRAYTAAGALVGEETLISGDSQMLNVTLGTLVGTAAGHDGELWFDDWVIDYTNAVYPLGPPQSNPADWDTWGGSFGHWGTSWGPTLFVQPPEPEVPEVPEAVPSAAVASGGGKRSYRDDDRRLFSRPGGFVFPTSERPPKLEPVKREDRTGSVQIAPVPLTAEQRERLAKALGIELETPRRVSAPMGMPVVAAPPQNRPHSEDEEELILRLILEDDEDDE
jgi:hypothetical protein